MNMSVYQNQSHNLHSYMMMIKMFCNKFNSQICCQATCFTKHMLSNICSYVWSNWIINKDRRNWRCQCRRRNAEHRNDNSLTKIKLWKGLGVMRKRKQEALLHTRRYKIHAEPEKYYHAMLLLYYNLSGLIHE